MFAKFKVTAIAGVCVLALVASACGGGSSEAVASGADSESTDSSSSANSGTSGSSDGEGESPLGDLLGLPITDDEAMDDYFDDLGNQAEIKIAECMLAQGFEYQVVDYSALGGAATSVDFDSREYAVDYGFGVASNPFEESFEAFESFKDPNQEYVQSLTPGEVDAYEMALSGSVFDPDADFQEFGEPGGCQGDAFEEVFAFGLVFGQFQDEFEAIEEAFEADARIVAATSGWGACMTEAGFRFSDVDSAEADIRRRYNSIVDDPDAYDDDADLGGTEVTVGDDAAEDVFFFGPGTLKPAFQQQVDELAVEERAIATASWDCNGPLREIEDDVQREYEQRFVDENGAAIREALGE